MCSNSRDVGPDVVKRRALFTEKSLEPRHSTALRPIDEPLFIPFVEVFGRANPMAALCGRVTAPPWLTRLAVSDSRSCEIVEHVPLAVLRVDMPVELFNVLGVVWF